MKTTKAKAGKVAHRAGKVPPKVSPHRKSRPERDMRMYFRLMDWADLWDDWYLSIQANGRPKYRTVWDLVKRTGKTKEQRKFLRWYLGPDLDGDGPSPYPWMEQRSQDWADKRRTRGWHSEENLKKYSAEIRRRVNGLEALREAGGITLHSLVRAERMAQEIDRAFGGQMFSDELDFHDNVTRSQAYIRLQGQLLGLKEKAMDLYAKSHGINFNDMAGLVALMTANAMTAQVRDGAPNREEAALAAVIRMAMAKSQKYGLELPPGAVEVIADEVELHDTKKKVQ